MIRKFTLPLTVLAMTATLNAPTQVFAQETEAEAEASEATDAELAKFLEIFKVEDDGAPIEPDQLARAETVAVKLLPDGSYQKMMAETMSTVIEPMLGSIDQMPLSAITTFAGISEDEISPPDDATIKDLMEIVDPHFADRQQAMFKSVFDILIELSDEVEPAIRDGLAKAYARRFTGEELDDISTFLSTDTGAKFGAESLAVYSSREVIGASMEVMPKFLERFLGQMQNAEELMGDIPPQRTYGDLSELEKKRLAQLLGVDVEDLGPRETGQGDYETEAEPES
ncbi:DUF2059 domain-containing protein [Alterisphingorhabdus coralli]|uniref:DUF2059 domain-containing protein n=1 Tax=Alterisphingorhabdus coralli TaxID=3071408 RepID=A0AA97F643_9SPHN|nr:DUF2059 domain-containing protein [Parasphingorhabdus sp. SCSIO 66989]WOE74921.1 DUF2059 domain-containing protein [Parasphingorhabdus sp. SCSIO 66989]